MAQHLLEERYKMSGNPVKNHVKIKTMKKFAVKGDSKTPVNNQGKYFSSWRTGSKCRCQVPGAQVPGVRFQVSCAQFPGIRCTGSRCQVPVMWCAGARCTGARFQVPSFIRCQIKLSH